MSELMQEFVKQKEELVEAVRQLNGSFQLAKAQYKEAVKNLKQQVKDIEVKLLASHLQLQWVEAKLQNGNPQEINPTVAPDETAKDNGAVLD